MFDDATPFTRADMRREGVEDSLLRRRTYTQVVRGVWVRRDAVDRFTLIRAALRLHPEGAFASHISAAEVHGLPVPDHAFAHVTVAHPEDRRFRPEIKPHVTGRRRHLTTRHEITCTDVIGTFIDCAGWLSLVDRVILGDAIVRKHGVTARKLLAACRRSTDYYAGLATEAAELVRDGVDSPMETRLRLLIVFAGLPEPKVDHRVYDEHGSMIRRYDLSYPSIRLIVEYDGKHHAEVSQWESDLERREEFDDQNERIIVVTSKGIYQEPERTLARIHRQLVLRGWPRVPKIDDRWREHFAA